MLKQSDALEESLSFPSMLKYNEVGNDNDILQNERFMQLTQKEEEEKEFIPKDIPLVQIVTVQQGDEGAKAEGEHPRTNELKEEEE